MLSLDNLIAKSNGKISLFKNLRLQAPKDLTARLTICIADMHLLEKMGTDDFFCGKQESEDRFLEFLDFLIELKKEESDLEIVQLGDMFDLWQAKGNTNLIEAAYTNIINLLDELRPTYVVGNHDIELVKRYEDQKETFGRVTRHYFTVNGKGTVIFEHGFLADFANNQSSLSGAIGREVTKLVAGLEHYVDPDIDLMLSSVWDEIVGAFNKYNELTPVRNPQGFNPDEYLRHYLKLLDDSNQGKIRDNLAPQELDLSLAVFGHTHKAKLVQMPKNGRDYFLMDCGSWVNGGHEIGIISGRDMAICQWG